MLKYKIDSITEAKKEGEDSVVYIQLYDDDKPDEILVSMCIPYKDDEQFQNALASKSEKHLNSAVAQSLLREKIESLLPQAEMNIEITKAEIILKQKEKEINP